MAIGTWRAGPFALFALLSLVAVAVGCFVVRASGAPVGAWARNLIAWGVGALLAGGLARWAGRRTALAFLAAAPLAVAATLAGAGQDGVHRWVQLGALRINAGEVLLPVAIVACAAMRSPHWLRWTAAAVTLALLVAQPDASQATAFGGALVVLLASPGSGRAVRLGGAALALVAVAVSWFRRDPLRPVPEVEGIMDLAGTVSPVLAIAAWIALVGAVLAPLAARSGAGVALAVYGALSALTPLAGAFPAPLVGMGMSPILGLWLGVGLLAAVNRRGALTFDPPHAPFRAS